MIRIVIADDHAIVREGLKRIVASAPDMEVLAEAADGTEVMQQVREADFDVLVLDLSMPGRSGMELIKLVKAQQPRLRILVLSMHQELTRRETKDRDEDQRQGDQNEQRPPVPLEQAQIFQSDLPSVHRVRFLQRSHHRSA